MSKKINLFDSSNIVNIDNDDSIVDIHEVKALVRLYQKEWQGLLSFLDVVPQIVFVSYKQELSYINDAAARLLHYSREELVGRNLFGLIADGSGEELLSNIFDISPGQSIEGYCDFIAKDGTKLPVYLFIDALQSEGGIALHGIAMNISDLVNTRNALYESKKMYSNLFNFTPMGILYIEIESGRIVDINDNFLDNMGYSFKKDIVHQSTFFELFKSEETRKRFFRQLREGGEITNFEAELKRVDGSTLWGNLNAVVEYEKGIIQLMLVDISENKHFKNSAIYHSSFDFLTSLPNKAVFNSLLSAFVINNEKFSLLCFEIDEYNEINDLYSVNTGDKLLKESSKRLEKLFKKQSLCRFDGVKFMIILEGINDDEDIRRVIGDIQNEFSRPFFIDNNEIRIESSIGVSRFPEHGNSEDILLNETEHALREAQTVKGNSYNIFCPSKYQQMINRKKMAKSIMRAIEEREFISYYQPKVVAASVDDFMVVGMESLVRWDSSEKGGIIAPYEFVPIAEENGLIHDIGGIILEKSCRQNKMWQNMGLSPLKVSVNISPYQFRQRDLIDSIKRSLDITQLDPRWLELEITESGIMENESDSIEKLTMIHDMGIDISIDDFGTGYSSLSKLKDYPIDIVKIDQSFVKHLPDEQKACTIVRIIIMLAHTLGFKVVAEGVETEEQLRFLIDNNCDTFQGWLFGKAMPSDEFEKLIGG